MRSNSLTVAMPCLAKELDRTDHRAPLARLGWVNLTAQVRLLHWLVVRPPAGGTLLAPISVPSLKDAFVRQIENLILSSQIAVGDTLPSERELAAQMGVSRPVVHDGLMDLAAKGLVTIKPRVGTVVNDYRKEGSLAVLSTLINHPEMQTDPALLQSLLAFRQLVESETARLAASLRTDDDLRAFHHLLEREEQVDLDQAAAVAELDFELHHRIALASKNIIYPMMLKSFEPAYTNLTTLFFCCREVTPVVFAFHQQLVAAIERGDEGQSVEVMMKTLAHGVEVLTQQIAGRTTREGNP